ncbi:MAG: PLP-dependent cysteine synthase family protein [Myxococcales bacterium]
MTQHDRDRAWADWAMRLIAADFRRSADTNLLPVHVPGFPGIKLYLKDESTHVTGSLKHRLARALFLYALANGNLREGTLVVEASSGSTAISEAYFARLLKLPFVAVMPAATSKEKVAIIESYGARCHLVDDPTTVYAVAARIAGEARGHYMDQFTFAERATDWRGNNNIAESIFQQMSEEEHPVPRWLVVGAGTGGTATTLGRYIRYRNYATQLCAVDPEHSVTFDYYRTGNAALQSERSSGIEGIGRPRVEPSFVRTVIHRMIKVPDAASYAAMFFLAKLIGKRTGPSTGTNLWAAFELMCEMAAAGEQGSVVTLICDSGERYLQTYYSDVWMAQKKIDLRAWRRQLKSASETGTWESLVPSATLDDLER